MASSWGHARKLGTRSRVGGARPGTRCPLEHGGSVGILCPSCPVLSTRQAGREPGSAAQHWHPTLLALCPALAGTGARLALLWGCVGWRGGCEGSVC